MHRRRGEAALGSVFGGEAAMSFPVVANLATCLHCLGKECLQSVWWRAGGPGLKQIPGLVCPFQSKMLRFLTREKKKVHFSQIMVISIICIGQIHRPII